MRALGVRCPQGRKPDLSAVSVTAEDEIGLFDVWVQEGVGIVGQHHQRGIGRHFIERAYRVWCPFVDVIQAGDP